MKGGKCRAEEGKGGRRHQKAYCNLSTLCIFPQDQSKVVLLVLVKGEVLQISRQLPRSKDGHRSWSWPRPDNT